LNKNKKTGRIVDTKLYCRFLKEVKYYV